MDKKRVYAYIDGFNFYNGLKDMKIKGLLWFDYIAFINSLINQNKEKLVHVKYFTSRINNNMEKSHRQNLYIDALKANSNNEEQETQMLEVIEGSFRDNKKICPQYKSSFNCNGEYSWTSEKKTDVNIAVNMIKDLDKELFDVAFLLSGDSDLVPCVDYLVNYKNSRVIAVFPYRRPSNEIRKIAQGKYQIDLKGFLFDYVKNSLLLDPVISESGKEFHCPAKWK